MNKLRVFEAFAGVGSQRMALRNIGIPHEVVGIAEVDKYALKSYEAIHGECPNFGDISQINPNDLPDMDLFTYSFPCQDISVAGKMEGISEGTRSGLLYECEKIIENKRPNYLLLENVKNLVGKKFKQDFDKWLDCLKSLGYTNYWQILNAKDYGVPQNRERVFVVSILDKNKEFKFPISFDNGIRLKDILEHEVDEKFYINNEKATKLIEEYKQQKIQNTNKPNLIGGFGEINFGKQYRQGNRVYDGNSVAMCHNAQPVGNTGGNTYLYICPCITPDRVNKRQNGRRFKEDGDPMFTLTSQDRHGILQLGNIVDTGNWDNPQRGRIYSVNGCSPSLNTVGGGGLEPKVLVEE